MPEQWRAFSRSCSVLLCFKASTVDRRHQQEQLKEYSISNNNRKTYSSTHCRAVDCTSILVLSIVHPVPTIHVRMYDSTLPECLCGTSSRTCAINPRNCLSANLALAVIGNCRVNSTTVKVFSNPEDCPIVSAAPAV